MSSNKKSSTSIKPVAKKENKVNAEIACDVLGVKDRDKFVALKKFLGQRMVIEDWKKAFKKDSLI